MIDPLIQRAEFLVAVGENATCLCPEHAQAFAVAAMILNLSPDLYEMDPEEPYMACQTCFMSNNPGPGQN